MNKLLTIVVLIALTAGCVHNRWRADEAREYVGAQADLQKNRPPLFELRAQPGQTITLSGVEALVVNDPRETRVDPLPVRSSGWLQWITSLSQIGATVYGQKLQADQLVDVVQTIGNVAVSIPRADNSVTYQVGGNLGDTDQSQTTTTTYGDGAVTGDGNVVGDANGDGDRAGGDQIVGDGNQNSGRIDSDDIDNSNPGDEGNVLPADPPDDGGG